MIVHQIFWDFYGKGMNDLFKKSNKRFEKWSADNGYEYILWDKKSCDNLIEIFPEYEELYNSARYEIMQVDIIRLLILYSMGGLYVDLDVFPNCKNVPDDKKLRFILDKTYTNRADNRKIITNEIIQMPKGHNFALDFIDFIELQIQDKSKKDVYKTWRKRFVTQTTGPYALTRFLKNYPYPYDFYTTNQLEFKNKGEWNFTGLGDTSDVDFITHYSLSWSGLS